MCESATLFLVPTRIPVLILTRGAAVPSCLALRADFEVLQMAHNLAPVVVTKLSPLQRYCATLLELLLRIRHRLHQPVCHVVAAQDEIESKR